MYWIRCRRQRFRRGHSGTQIISTSGQSIRQVLLFTHHVLSARPDFQLATGRYSANGMLDTGFGNNGVVDLAAIPMAVGFWWRHLGCRVRQLVSYVTPPATVGVCVEALKPTAPAVLQLPEPLNTPLGQHPGDVRTAFWRGGNFMVGAPTRRKRAVPSRWYRPMWSAAGWIWSAGAYEFPCDGCFRSQCQEPWPFHLW